MPPPVSLGELTFQQQEDVGNIRTQIQGSCDRARRNIEILKDVLPKLQQYRLYTQKKLKSGLVLIDSEAVHFDEVEKPGTYSEALALLHPREGPRVLPVRLQISAGPCALSTLGGIG